MPATEAHLDRPADGGHPDLTVCRSRRHDVDFSGLAADLAREARALGREDRVTVFILTFCRKADLLYGSTLVFKTLRVGFPGAAVVVVDNASIPQARAEIAPLARDTDCRFLQIEAPSVEHHDFLSDVLEAMAGDDAPTGPVVFLDPDVCLWSCCEGFAFDGLMAGRYIRPSTVPATGALVLPRLHTSFLWIPDARRLWARIAAIKAVHFDFDPFRSVSIRMGAQWVRADTGASLYGVIRAEASHFADDHLDCYDHLFCGCHLDLLEAVLVGKDRDIVRRIHDHARAGDLSALKGAWREQTKIGQPARRRAAAMAGGEGNERPGR